MTTNERFSKRLSKNNMQSQGNCIKMWTETKSKGQKSLLEEEVHRLSFK